MTEFQVWCKRLLFQFRHIIQEFKIYNKCKPRRKYVEELVDTDDSDATSDDSYDSVAQPYTSEPSANESSASKPIIVVADGKIACETCGQTTWNEYTQSNT